MKNLPSLQEPKKDFNRDEQKALPYLFQQEKLKTCLTGDEKSATQPKETMVLKDIELECASCKKIFSSKIVYLRHQWAHQKYRVNTLKYKGTRNDCLPCTERDWENRKF